MLRFPHPPPSPSPRRSLQEEEELVGTQIGYRHNHMVQSRLDFGCMKQASALYVVIWLPEEKKEMRNREMQMPLKYYHAQDFLATHFSICQEKFYSTSIHQKKNIQRLEFPHPRNFVKVTVVDSCYRTSCQSDDNRVNSLIMLPKVKKPALLFCSKTIAAD
uniref:Uncharacterized protein n=1 Tax=Solanum lycopersicum TaxID=4081 RepID=A0A3Q7GZD5_SOLLC